MANVIQPNNNTSLYNSTGNAIPTTGNLDANNINASGNVVVGGYIIANGSITTESNFVGNLVGNVTGNVTGNIVLSGGNTEIIYNNNGVTGSSPAFTFNQASNVVSATGNITANYYFGNGSQLTGLPATYSNANVEALLPVYTGDYAGANINLTGYVSATGNVTGNYILGNGSQLTGITTNYSNANVQAYLPTYTGNLNPNFVSATGNVTAAVLKTSGATGNIVGANYVSANFYLGDGGLLSNITSSYGNAQVAAYLTTYTGNLTAGNVSATGNITGTYFIGNGSQLTGLPAGYSNADVNSHLAAFGSNTISTTGNVTAGYFLGDGSQLTNLPVQPGTYANANVANYLPTYSGNIAVTNLTAATTTATGNISIGGNITLTATPEARILSSQDLRISAAATEDLFLSNPSIAMANIWLDAGNIRMAQNSGSGNTNVLVTGQITATGNITGNYLIGDGSLITNLPGGSYGNANVANYLPTFSGNLTAGNISATGNITGAYILGNGSQLTGLPAGYSNTDVNNHLAAFGSNTISTTGNVTVGYIIGDGSQLTNLPAGNYSNANVANYLPTYSGNIGTLNSSILEVNGDQIHIHATNAVSNVNGISLNTPSGGSFVAMETPKVYIAEPTGGGGTQLQVAGNISTSPGNVLVTGYVTATGNVTGNYFIGNGSQLTGLPAGYSNADVNSHLAAFGSNTISTTGNVTAGYFFGDGSQLTNLPAGSYSNANVSAFMGAFGSNTISTTGTVTAGNITGGNLLTSGVITATGTVTAGNVIYTNVDGTTGQVLTTYGNGVTYFSTVSGGSGSPGGADTQIQFNNANAFAGNSNMTFNVSTGNITLGNIVTNVNKVQTVSAIDQSNVTAFGTTTPWRIMIGNGYVDGTANSVYSLTSPGTVSSVTNSARALVADYITMPNNGSRFCEQVTMTWVAWAANISNASTRVSSQRNEITVGGGSSNYNYTGNNTTAVTAVSNQLYLGRGTNANLSAVGNTISTGVMTNFNQSTISANSQANLVIGVQSQIQGTDNSGSGYGNAVVATAFYASMPTGLSNTSVTPTTSYTSYYHPGTSNSLGLSYTSNMGVMVRNATDYYAFRNDDVLAKAKLGMLDSFHELNANTATTTGNITISKTDGQVQTIYPTGNVTIASFTGFQTRVQKPNSVYVNTADTVTLMVHQGATPYTVTMPTGNANIRYNNGTSTVPSTANTTVMISITGTYNYTSSANQYLVTISGEFS